MPKDNLWENMSIATKQQASLLTFQNHNKEQQVSKFFKEKQQWNRKKSIDATIKSEKHVTKSKQLTRQTPVAVSEKDTEEESEGEGGKSEKEKEDIVTKALQNIYDDDNYMEQDDYQIYQDGNVNEFFMNEILEKPKSIADICLVNDHFILVKMTEAVKALKQQELTEKPPTNLTTADMRRKNLKALREQQKESQEDISQRDNRKLCRSLRTKRNRITRIAPIHEEPEDCLNSNEKKIKQQSKLHCLNVHSCWKANGDDIEVYHSQTKIQISPQNSSCLNPKNYHNSQGTKDIPDDFQKPKELQTISGSLIQSSLKHQVSLRSYGSLVSKENNNNLEIGNSHKSCPPVPARRKCPRFESFYWLLRPFRGKYRKPKPQIQAVVYKTYFVKWTKPPDTLSHGYGVKSSQQSEMAVSVLRRCRSAIF